MFRAQVCLGDWLVSSRLAPSASIDTTPSKLGVSRYRRTGTITAPGVLRGRRPIRSQFDAASSRTRRHYASRTLQRAVTRIISLTYCGLRLGGRSQHPLDPGGIDFFPR